MHPNNTRETMRNASKHLENRITSQQITGIQEIRKWKGRKVKLDGNSVEIQGDEM